MNSEFHISSFVIQCRPQAMTELCDILPLQPGLEIHQTDDNNGKIIITLETDDTQQITDITKAIGQMPHVLSCNMVFHQFESADSPISEQIETRGSL